MTTRALILIALLLGGCVAGKDVPLDPTSDAAATKSAHAARDTDDPDKPRSKCFATSVGGQPEDVCY